jgi:Protein of unknown function (DUF3768)
MAAEQDPAPFSIEAALPLYLAARAAVKEVELELQHAQAELGAAPAALSAEIGRLKRALQEQQRALIRALNDRFRSSFAGGRVLVTQGVNAKGQGFLAAATSAIQTFNTFTPDNDPQGEHDFGSLTVGGVKLYWKIDYYDQAELAGSEDPADPAVTTRVLTILLPEEY